MCPCDDANEEAAAYQEELMSDGPSTSAWVEDAAAWDRDLEQRRFEVRKPGRASPDEDRLSFFADIAADVCGQQA